MRWFWHTLRLVLIFIIISALAALTVSWFHFIDTPVITQGNTVEYTLKPGTGLTTLAWDLKRMGYMPKPRYFIWLAKFKGQATRLQAGHYKFKGPLTPPELLEQVVDGEIIQSRLTIVEGWNFTEMMNAVDGDNNLKHDLLNKKPDQIMAMIGHPGQHPEGRFYPDTYHFPAGMTDIKFLQNAYDLMQQKLAKAWEQRAANLPFKKPYQALIAASLIEKETSLDSEKTKIAGVLVRRLRKNMLLQFDPTVIYGLGKAYNGDLTRKNLRQNTPYNTYIHKGLPPTPIAMPGITSIEAALHPAPGKALYFVASGNGGHIFSNTLKEHNQAIIEYLRSRKKRRNQSPRQPSLKIQEQLIPPQSLAPETCFQAWVEGSGESNLADQQLCYQRDACQSILPYSYNGHHCLNYRFYGIS